ncbi:aminotransferase class I/II-fold pyridoxal phosphate-dependent enzyme [Gaetbulibacter saemankumensis]|uniref:aminotransferase class I/II-fold pyridoxal phosphate-dependent enzyme n=1 Tax=Gaetbulibacter saemankumensis TaxID=311208 RepID=UPI000425E7CD|nr:pyridoxal phosphate-dependent aminotransferase family protein [Gaetbulibacter saemankumensis]
MNLPKKLQQKLDDRIAKNALRTLKPSNNLIDFSSNDYLGFSKSEFIFKETHAFLKGHHIAQNGATGSRLLSGNHRLYPIVESILSHFHNSESALIYNSGYNANIGFFSSVPQRGDIILYDEYIHASIRDGITMSHAKAYKFKHNDLNDLASLISRFNNNETIYVVTESVFSMDGDSPDLIALSNLCKTHYAYLIVDEAHALGVFGKNGSGRVQELGTETHVFARIVTFGKALGCHGAAIICDNNLKQYLINFSRSLIYTTALSPHALATIQTAYQELTQTPSINQLKDNIAYFKLELQKNNLQNIFIESDSAIQCCIIPGNEYVKNVALKIQNLGFDAKAILSPTVPINQERLRFCLHSYNSKKEIKDVLKGLATFACHKPTVNE